MSDPKATLSQIFAAIERHGSQAKAAGALGMNVRTLERRLARVADEAVAPKLLVLDIETSPNIAYTWGLWNQNVAINQIVEPGRVLCFAAKWHGEDGTVFYSERQRGGAERMIRAAHRLLRECDGLVGWNSAKFDTRWLNQEFFKLGLSRPAGYKQIDLMKQQKRFRWLQSNKLDYAAQHLGVGAKEDTGGFQLWRDCLAGKRKAWQTMETYNRQDVELTDKLLTRMLSGGWITGLPNIAIHGGDCCPACGSENLQADGYYQTQTRRYQQWLCRDCGFTSRSVKCEPGSAKLKEAA